MNDDPQQAGCAPMIDREARSDNRAAQASQCRCCRLAARPGRRMIVVQEPANGDPGLLVINLIA